VVKDGVMHVNAGGGWGARQRHRTGAPGNRAQIQRTVSRCGWGGAVCV